MISFHSPTLRFKLSQKTALKKWLKAVAEAESKRMGAVSFIFCSDEELLRINRRYLQHNYYTDVITFDETNGAILAGDVFVGINTVRANADKYKQTFDNELHRVMLHGVLHLCGYADRTPAEQKQMRAKEDFYLAKM
jgi:rRNA maturation RNase YbeY